MVTLNEAVVSSIALAFCSVVIVNLNVGHSNRTIPGLPSEVRKTTFSLYIKTWRLRSFTIRSFEFAGSLKDKK
jgi:hypothetical protein